METIFVQIASYRDSELVPTVMDCISKASDSSRLYFGICAQCDPINDDLEDLLFIHSNIKLKVINYTQSKGTCWARSIAQSLYSKQTYSLQIDSHMRFTDNWDIKLIEIWKSLNDKKAVLSAYPGKYYPDEPQSMWPIESPTACGVYRIHKNRFKQRGYFIPDDLESPIKGVAISAAYLFGSGDIINDVPYDPNLYFEGEEMSIALRLFTNGYNIYHPNKVLLYHYWLRESSPKHWSDYSEWAKYDKIANERLDALLGLNDIDLGIYGLGKVRTIEDYRIYSGIDVIKEGIHSNRTAYIEPPIDYSFGEWNYPKEKEKIKLKLKWNTDEIPTNYDITYWLVSIMDSDNIEVHSFWIGKHDNPKIILLKKKSITTEFEYIPNINNLDEFIIQPYSEVDGWLNKHRFSIT